MDPPLTLNPVPEAEALEIVTFEFPVFVSVTFCIAAVPSVTVPKLRLETFGESLLVDATPVPLKGIIIGELLASLPIETLPEAAVVDVGLNATVKFVLAPAARVTGAESPDMLNPVPVIAAWEIVSSAVPVFDSFIV